MDPELSVTSLVNFCVQLTVEFQKILLLNNSHVKPEILVERAIVSSLDSKMIAKVLLASTVLPNQIGKIVIIQEEMI